MAIYKASASSTFTEEIVAHQRVLANFQYSVQVGHELAVYEVQANVGLAGVEVFN